MWTSAIEDAIVKTRNNIDKFGDFFPWTGLDGGDYKRSNNEEWTDGFWSGLLWMCYEYTSDETFRKAAVKTVQSFNQRLIDRKALDHHDIGFLYLPSVVAQWIIDRDENALPLGLRAAEVLLDRWRTAGQYIQAWGPAGDPQNGGRIIIDCLLNLPLLYWAYEKTGNVHFRDIAIIHAEKSRRYLVRGDDSSYHTFTFQLESGDPIGGSTHQGYSDGSTWTRGQAWGIYGFILSYKYTGNSLYLETSRRMARYFITHLPDDYVTYWDFDLPDDLGNYRDSSATAIACCGILELLQHLNQEDTDYDFFNNAVNKSMYSLVENYSTMKDPNAEGLLKHGSYYVRGNLSPDDYVIWGDYFYLEALMRIVKGIPGYWYERN